MAATILPLSSEAALLGLFATTAEPWPALIAVASLGNILGSMTNWGIGRGMALATGHPAFPLKREKLDRAERWYRKWGAWSLLFSWVPVVGDPLTVVAGFLREPVWIVLALVSVAKVGRYAALAAIAANWI